MKNSKNKFKINSLRFLTVIFASYFIISCGPTRNETSQISSEEVTPVLIQELNNTSKIEIPVSETSETIEQPSPQLSEEIEETNTLVKLNPPHGEPGHRCDIAVGAPLDTPNPGNIVLNPPHGEPGHRCDIAVGAPLDTPPPSNLVQTTNSAAQTASNATTVAPVTSTLNMPGGPTLENAAKLNSSRPISYTPAINPPHGQPGHRCDIPVGNPLPS